jgi:hypothetical protein
VVSVPRNSWFDEARFHKLYEYPREESSFQWGKTTTLSTGPLP